MSNGNFIDPNTLSDNDKRLHKMNGTYNFIKTEQSKKNVQPKLVEQSQCLPKYACDGEDLRESRVNKTDLRQPIQVVRKETEMNLTNNRQCSTHTLIYKDNYSQCDNNTLGVNSCPANNGSLPNSNLNNIKYNLNQDVSKSKSGNFARTAKPLIRSGMQPNTAGQQNSGLSYVGNQKRQTYSYSYRELLNNRRKTTVTKSLAYVTNQGNQSGIYKYGYGGEKTDPICTGGTVVDRLNNKKFYKQGSVDCGTRLERLKLEAIRGQSKCSSGMSQVTGNTCNGVYFGGKKRFLGVKSLYNNNNPEINNPQDSARRRVRGNYAKKPYVEKIGKCCDCSSKNFTTNITTNNMFTIEIVKDQFTYGFVDNDICIAMGSANCGQNLYKTCHFGLINKGNKANYNNNRIMAIEIWNASFGTGDNLQILIEGDHATGNPTGFDININGLTSSPISRTLETTFAVDPSGNPLTFPQFTRFVYRTPNTSQIFNLFTSVKQGERKELRMKFN